MKKLILVLRTDRHIIHERKFILIKVFQLISEKNEKGWIITVPMK